MLKHLKEFLNFSNNPIYKSDRNNIFERLEFVLKIARSNLLILPSFYYIFYKRFKQ